MRERIKVSINGGKVYEMELDKVLQAMVDIVDKFANEADALRAEVAELRDGLGHYAEPTNWTCCQPDFVHRCGREECLMTQYEGDGQGWDVAKAVLDKHK